MATGPIPTSSSGPFGRTIRRFRPRTAGVVLLVVALSVSSGFAVAALAPRSGGEPVGVILPAHTVVLSPGSDYTTYLGNLQRTSDITGEAQLNVSSAPSLHLLWSYDARQSVQSQPVEQNGTIYFGDKSGYEYALYAINGTLRWRTFLGQAKSDVGCANILGVTSTATIDGNTLYVDGGFPKFYALNLTTGAILWDAPIGSGGSAEGFYDWSSPLIYGGYAYVGIASDCDHPLVKAGLDQYSLTTDSLVNYFDSSVPKANGSSIWGSPAINPATNTVFVGTGPAYGNVSQITTYSESIVALNATSLAVERSWQVPLSQATPDGDFGVTPTLYTPTGGYPMLSAANKNGILYAFYQSNLTVAWEQRVCCGPLGENEHISTAYADNSVFSVSSITSIAGVTYNSSVRAFNASTGALEWQDGFPQFANYGYAAPQYVNGLLLVGDEGSLYGINATNGQVVYQSVLGSEIQAAPSVARGEVYVGDYNGFVYAFDLELKASAGASQLVCTVPCAESFTGSATGGLPAYSYHWVFGDGRTSLLQDPTHIFQSAGTYNVTLNVTDLAHNVTSTNVTVVAETGYSVTFRESGLPANTSWNLTLGSTTYAMSTGPLTLTEPNGTYPFSVAPPAAYSANVSSGSVTVAGAAVIVRIGFAPAYAVTFSESGLPPSGTWTVVLDGVAQSVNGSTAVFWEPNGTYAFSVLASGSYTPRPASGSVIVTGSPVSQPVVFGQTTYAVQFDETGLVAGSSWTVVLNGTPSASTSSTIDFAMPNGTFSYSVASVPGYLATPASGSVPVAGGSVVIPIAFAAAYNLTFFASGLPSGTLWNVTIGSDTVASTTSYIGFTVPNGTYPFLVGAVPGWRTTDSGSVLISGANKQVTRLFSAVTYAVTFTETGLPSVKNWSVGIGASNASSTSSTIVVREPNGTYAYTVGNVSGYKSSGGGQVTVSGTGVSVSVHFTVVKYVVTFTESGLPLGTFWRVHIGTTNYTSTGSSLNVSLANGTTAYVASSAPRFSTSSGNVTVVGSPVSVSITFSTGGGLPASVRLLPNLVPQTLDTAATVRSPPRIE